MNTNLMKSGALAAALLAGTSAQAGNLKFDRNGLIPNAGNPEIRFDAFDWNFGNLLMDEIFPAPPTASGLTKAFDVWGAATLSAWQPGSIPVLPGTEITYVFRAPSAASVFSSGGGIEVDLHSLASPGYFEIYFDDFGASGTYAGGVAADDLSGLGYDDGHLILSGHFLGGGGGLIINSTMGCGFGLDGNNDGTDNDGGVTTCNISGSLSYTLEVDSFDSDFFKDDIEVIGTDFSFTSDNSAPFSAANPSSLVVGNAPVFGNGINDSSCGAASDCDLQLESDGRSVFFAVGVPEPLTVGLMGLGLVAAGAATRRRKTV